MTRGPRLLPPLFLTLTILALLVGQISHAQTASQPVPLEWHDNPDELLPGYTIELRVHGFATVINWMGAFADAAGCVGNICFGLTGDSGPAPVHVELIMGGHQYEIDKVWMAPFKEYDAYFTLKLYCPGERPEGAPGDAPSGYAWLYAEARPWGYKHWFLVDVRDRLAPDLNGYYEANYAAKSWYEFYDATKFRDCGVDYIGDLPDDRSGNAPGDDQQSNIDIEKYAMYGIGVVAALGALAILVNRR